MDGSIEFGEASKMGMEISGSGIQGTAFDGQQARQTCSLPGGIDVMPMSEAGGSLLEDVAKMAVSWRDAIAAADQGMRACQVR